MDQDVVRFHREAWNLIPWVVNGTADAAQRTCVETHLAQCPDCQDEFRFHQSIHAGVNALVVPVHEPGPAFARLMSTIDTACAETTARAALAAPRYRKRRMPMAACVLQSVALGALGSVLWMKTQASDYATPSDSHAQTHAPTSIWLVLAPHATLESLQSLVASERLRVVDISPDGKVFGLATASEGASLDAGSSTRQEAAISALRAHPEVMLAEPVDPNVGVRP